MPDDIAKRVAQLEAAAAVLADTLAVLSRAQTEQTLNTLAALEALSNRIGVVEHHAAATAEVGRPEYSN